MGANIKRYLYKLRKPLVTLLIALFLLFGVGILTHEGLNLFEGNTEAQDETGGGEIKVNWDNLKSEYTVNVEDLSGDALMWQVSEYLPRSMDTETLILNKAGDFGTELIRSMLSDGELAVSMVNTALLSEKGYHYDEDLFRLFMTDLSTQVMLDETDVSLYSARLISNNEVEAIYRFASLSESAISAEDAVGIEAVYPSSSIYSLRLTVWFDEKGAPLSFIPCRVYDLPEEGYKYGFLKD